MPLASVTILAMEGQHFLPSTGFGRFAASSPMLNVSASGSTGYQFSKAQYNHLKLRQIRVFLRHSGLNPRANCL